MASVGETDPWLVAGSDPDCVTTNQDRDTTYAGTGPDQLPLANDGKENGQCYWIGKDRPHQRTHLIQRKKRSELHLLLLLLLFLLLLYTFLFNGLKASN
jgi:hypothetical protein